MPFLIQCNFFLHYGMSIPQRWGWIKKDLRNPKSAVNSILLEFSIVGIGICLRYYCGSRTLEHSFILLKRAESYPRGKYIMLWLKTTRRISSKSLYNNHLNIHRTLLSILRILRISKGPWIYRLKAYISISLILVELTRPTSYLISPDQFTENAASSIFQESYNGLSSYSNSRSSTYRNYHVKSDYDGLSTRRCILWSMFFEKCSFRVCIGLTLWKEM